MDTAGTATYKEIELTAYKITVQLTQMLKKEPPAATQEWFQRLHQIEQQIQTKKFRMAVVGEFKRGKSSLINVLLGKRILPEDTRVTTATINRITYGETPKAYVVMKNGGMDHKEIPVEDLSSYVTKLTESAARAASEIKEAVVEYPTMLCYNDVDLIDTPGMNDMDDMTAVTVNQLEDIDLAVVAISAELPYSETENKFVLKLLESKKVCQIIIVVTHFDAIRDKEKDRMIGFLRSRIQENLLTELSSHYEPNNMIFQKYHDIFDQIRIYGVSSVDAMDALDSNDMELYKKSGFLQLSRELPEVILSSKSVSMMDNIVTLLEEIMKEYEKYLKEEQMQWKKWKTEEMWLKNLFAIEIQKLNDVAEKVFQTETWNRELEQIQQEAVRNMLNALGTVSVVTYESVHAVLMPVMQQEFTRINEFNRNRRQKVFQVILKQQWSPILEKTVECVERRMEQYSMLKGKLRTEQEQFFKLSSELTVFGNDDGLTEETAFYWLESPVQSVMQTDKNQSVLPGIRRIVQISMSDCQNRMMKNMREVIARDCLLVNAKQNAFLQALKELTAKYEQGFIEESPSVSELRQLQTECEILHRKLRMKK